MRCWRNHVRGDLGFYPAGHPDLADCRHQAVLNVLTGTALQNHREGETAGILEGQMQPHLFGECGTGPRAGR